MRLCFISLLICVAFSCKRNEKPIADDTPAAFDQSDYSLKETYSRSSPSLLQKLYEESVEKNQQLKTFETDLRAYRSQLRDTLDVFRQYDANSKSYYEEANSMNGAIRDTALKQKIRALIEQSQNEYASSTRSIVELAAMLDSIHADVEDYHRALIVVTTLPMIAKYQKNERPDREPFEAMLKRQQQVLEREKNLVR